MTKIAYYYLRDVENKPRITVCFCVDKDTKKTARGIAVCSKKDNPNKKVGRSIAQQRCKHALLNEQETLPFRENFFFPKMAFGAVPPAIVDGFKSEFNPKEYTIIEKKLMEKLGYDSNTSR
jgi:hypothetical protein